MEIIVLPDRDSVGRVAAGLVAEQLRAAGDRPVLGVATGSSPVPTYQHLARLVADGSVDLSGARVFALDEYVGLPPGHLEGYAEVVRRTVTEPLRLDPTLVHVPDGFADDLDAAAADYERALAEAGGVDVQVIGIGGDGHLGFNMPGGSFDSRTHVGTLSEQTRHDNARFFASPDEVPSRCLTQGLGTIMEHRSIVLVADGRAKAEAVAAMVEGPVDPSCPASILQRHRRTVVVLDQAAASSLRRTHQA